MLVGRTRTLFIGLAVFAFVPLSYLFVTAYEALGIVRFFHGFATAIYGPVVMAVVVSAAREKKGEMLSWFSSVTVLGNLTGAPVGGLLLTWLSGAREPSIRDFHIIYGVVAAMGLGAFIGGLLTMRGRWDRPHHKPGRTMTAVFARFRVGVKEILLDRRVLLTSNMEGVQNLSVGALEAFLPIYSVMVCGFSAFQAGLLWGIQMAVTLITKPLTGKISDQLGRQGLLFWGMFVCAIPFALIP